MSIRHEVYTFFANYIFKNFGILYSEKEFYRLDNRLKKLCDDLNADSIDNLYHLFQIKVTLEMHEALIRIATNNETYFFRDIKPFNSLTDYVIPKLTEEMLYPELRIWSVACSSGQEPCSIAISIAEKNSKFFPTLKIDACDISQSVIEKAKSGIYTDLELQRGLSEEIKNKYFLPTSQKDNLKIRGEILNKISYSLFNLMTGVFPKGQYHIIFCRNVLIYQNKENREMILNKLSMSLKDGGVLLLGSGESLIGLDVDLEQKNFGDSMYFIKKSYKNEKKAVA